MKRLYVGIIILCFFLFPTRVLAVHKLIISSETSSLAAGDSLTVTLAFSGFTTDETIYVKGAFFSEGSTNYFGLTKNGDSWVKNSGSATSQLSIKTSSAPVVIQVKNDSSDSGFHGEGEYKFKVGYYYLTSGGNLSSINWSDTILSVHLAAPAPTNTPTPLPTPTSLPSPTPTVLPIVSTAVALRDEHTGTNILEAEGEFVPESPKPEVLGIDVTSTPMPPTISVQIKSISTSSQGLVPILIGLGFMMLCAILICRKLWNFKFPFEH
jgi:hypothetical protein